MQSLSVFCGASAGNKEIYRLKAEELGRKMCERNIDLVFGGGKVGMMGFIADEVIKNNGKVTGVIPHFLSSKEVEHDGCSEIIRVDTMHDRKMEMFKISQGAIAMPGGYGTFDEVFEMLTWAQLGLHTYPIGFLNINSYFDSLCEMVENMYKEGFLKQSHLNMIIIEEDIDILLDKMEKYQAPEVPKWIRSENI
ncbi:MAG: TIGR00730 family Rossman fold protein [Bacteroidota bacterium]